jgi:5-methylcytosine-specific restriction endonuclease McrA
LRNKNQLGEKETLTIDHIRELDKGGDDALYNMQVLCLACHKLKNWTRLYMNWHLKGRTKEDDTKTVS